MSSSLLSRLLEPEVIDEVIANCAQLVRDEVAQKRGMTGVVVKGGLKVVERVRPGILADLFYGLLPQFIDRLSPLYQRYLDASPTEDNSEVKLSALLRDHPQEVIEALLSVTDERAERSKLTALVGVYRKLRPLAEDHIGAALPALGALLDRYTLR